MSYLTRFLLVAFWVVIPPQARAASETPPKGPPWTKDFLEAQRIAYEQGKPIFIYSTKTH